MNAKKEEEEYKKGSKWEEMSVVIPQAGEDWDSGTVFTPKSTISNNPSDNGEYLETPIAKLISVRTVFVLISLITVFSMAVGLITMNYKGQEEIAQYLLHATQVEIDNRIIHTIGDIFSWADEAVTKSSYFFYGLSIPPNGTILPQEWAEVTELMWYIARQRDTGVEVEVDLIDNRFFGVDNYDPEIDLMADMFDYTNQSDPDSNMTVYVWEADLNKPIKEVNYSRDNYLYTQDIPPPYPIYDFLRNTSRDYLTACNEHYWADLYTFSGNVLTWIVVSVCIISFIFAGEIFDYWIYGTLCDNNNNLLGYIAVNIDINSFETLLSVLTQEYTGKIFIMDHQYQLVTSSTFTPIYKLGDGNSFITAERETVYTTNEQWIKDVFGKMNGLGDQSAEVVINGTIHLLSVTNWNQYQNINWVIVKLLVAEQFQGNTQNYVRRSVAVSLAVAGVAVVVVVVATYFATRPLLILARKLQRMSRLELESDADLETPRLIEVKRLHHSFIGMNAALRSFRKFVPVQIVSKIIRSKKEVIAELHPANITIMFQDIEGFTSLSETMDPNMLAALTNMSVMTDIICKHGGTIDKYVGDCIMSLFNTPEELPNHPTAATAAAVECHLTLIEKNKEWNKKYGTAMYFRTGINTGEVLIGNMGSDNRMNYTAFGDNVNIAARLEGVNKLFGTRICVSKEVQKNFPKGKFAVRKLGKIRVSGKQVASTVYEVHADTNRTTEILFGFYALALKAFKHKLFDIALSEIEKALEVDPTDHASIHLKERILEVLDLPELPPTWSYTEGLVKF